MNLWVIFLTGLTTGGLSCLAVQGGLLTSIIANQKEEELESLQKNTLSKSFDQLDWVPVVLFLISKLIAYTILGFLLGWVGGKLQLSVAVRLIFQGIAVLFMLGTAMNLLSVHPIFRYLVIQPPRFVRKWLKGTTKGKAFFTPAILGFMTILIPCGVTQSMEVLAISSGNAVLGATILGAFVLGTSPLFAIIGVATAKLSEAFHDKFIKFAALALIYLSIVSLNGILVVLNSPLTLETVTHPITYLFSQDRFKDDTVVLSGKANTPAAVITQNGVQKVTIQVATNGYEPKTFKVKAGMPVQLTVTTKDTYSCASTFLMKSFGVNLQLAPTDSQTVTFTPTQPGKYPFNCSMGMYKGEMEVISNDSNV